MTGTAPTPDKPKKDKVSNIPVQLDTRVPGRTRWLIWNTEFEIDEKYVPIKVRPVPVLHELWNNINWFCYECRTALISDSTSAGPASRCILYSKMQGTRLLVLRLLALAGRGQRRVWHRLLGPGQAHGRACGN